MYNWSGKVALFRLSGVMVLSLHQVPLLFQLLKAHSSK